MDKTWANIKSFISTEYAKENKQNILMARQFKANAIEQQVEAMEEIINALTEKHMEQMENLIKSTTEAMKKMMELVQSSNKGDNNDKTSKDDKKKKQEEKCQKYNAAPVCKHCNKKHPNNVEDKCWEQEKNAQLEVQQKYLRVHGVYNRNQYVAAGKSAGLNKTKPHSPGSNELLDPTGNN